MSELLRDKYAALSLENTDLQRTIAQQAAVIKEQKETTELLNNACSVYSKRCKEQSALIEKLAEALEENRYSASTAISLHKYTEALADLSKYRELCDVKANLLTQI